MTWTELTPLQQSSIIKRWKNGENHAKLAVEFDLNAESLSRKIRHLTANNTIHYYLNYTPENEKIEYAQQDAFDIKITNIESVNPSERIAFVKSKKDVLRILIYSDPHFGMHDTVALNAFLRSTPEIPCDLILSMGDNLDFYGLSTFSKNPQLLTQSLQSEIDSYSGFIESLNALTKVPKLSLIGNHELRYFRYLETNPYLYAVRDYSLDRLLKIEEYNFLPLVSEIMINPSDDIYSPDPALILIHGTKASKHGGISARTQSEDYGYTSLGVGHTHKLSVVMRRTLRGQVTSFECGTLSTLNPEWQRYPNYNQGFMYVEVEGDFVSATPVPIYNGKALFCGKRI
jgi:hypothetical protein